MQTFLRLARASKIVSSVAGTSTSAVNTPKTTTRNRTSYLKSDGRRTQDKHRSNRYHTSHNHHQKRNNNDDDNDDNNDVRIDNAEEEETLDDDGTIAVKRLTSIVERVQRQYGNGIDRLTFAMACAVLLRVARCQYLYRAEFLGSTGIQIEILDATAFGALCREKLAPLYLHMMSQLGVGPEGRRGEEETERITVGGATYLLERSKVACQTNQPIQLDQLTDFVDGNELNRMSSSPPNGLMLRKMMTSSTRRNNTRSSSSSRKPVVGNGDNQSWEDVVRQLRSANDIADGLLVGTPGTTPQRQRVVNDAVNENDENQDTDMKIQLQATTDAALQLEAENQELRRILLEQSSGQ
jgi:hypothetical protein